MNDSIDFVLGKKGVAFSLSHSPRMEEEEGGTSGCTLYSSSWQQTGRDSHRYAIMCAAATRTFSPLSTALRWANQTTPKARLMRPLI